MSAPAPMGGAQAMRDDGVLVGVDIGGTFTDIVAVLPDGSMISAKVPSTPPDFSAGIHEGLRQLFAGRGELGAVGQINHGTTVATNCVLEKKGARTALVTTAGFRDVLEIGRVRVPLIYDLDYAKPEPLVERRFRLEADERMDAQGNVVAPFAAGTLAGRIAGLREQGIEAVAVCLVNAYANPAHERALGALLAQTGLHFSLSSDLLREIGEYERTSTTVLNAYLMPVVSAYLDRLRARLAELRFAGDLMVMASNGGLMDVATASAKPAFMIESGLAAGGIAAQAIGRVAGYPNLIAFDMGGTTAKASIIEDGQVSESPELEVGSGISYGRKLIGGGGYPVRATVIDLAEVGAGGGSIVWFDSAGGLHVGPQSTGAAPGPACYGRGGTLPTVTDACSVLGYLGEALAGGSVPLYPERARAAIESHLGARLAKPLHEIAWGIYEIATANMMRTIKAVSVERGRDPRDFALIAFGGNGALFAARLAHSMGMRRVVVPPVAGLFSVIGLLTADAKDDLVISAKHNLATLGDGELAALVAAQERDFLARRASASGGASGGASGTTDANAALKLARSVDLRYLGQSSHLTLPLPEGTLAADAHRTLIEAFHAAHRKTYGHHAPGEAVDLLNLRLTAIAHAGVAPERLARMAQSAHPITSAAPATTTRRAWFGPEAGWHETPVLQGRAALGEAGRNGPLIIEEYDATLLVPPGWRATLDPQRNVLIEFTAAQGEKHA